MKTSEIAAPVMLGDTYLDDCISPPEWKVQHDRDSQLASVLEKITDSNEQNGTLNVEFLPLRLLYIKIAGFAGLNPRFLEMSNLLDYEGHDIRVPKFSVFRLTDEGFDKFSLLYSCGERDHGILARFFESQQDPGIRLTDLPKPFRRPLLRSTEFYRYSQKIEDDPTPKGVEHKFRGMGYWDRRRLERMGSVLLTSEFHGIIPRKTKQKLAEAVPIFGDQLCLIAETKPEEWNEEKIIADPLLVGVLQNKCYLIDHFDTTPLEEYVRREMTSD